MPVGTVIFFNAKSKFGFIKSNDDGLNYYVNAKNLLDKNIQQNDSVVFELKDARRGKEAVGVKKIPAGPGSRSRPE